MLVNYLVWFYCPEFCFLSVSWKRAVLRVAALMNARIA